MQSKITLKKPFILVLYGFPGSGKTTFARQFCEEFGMVHLQEDQIKQEFFGNNQVEPRVQQKAIGYLAGELLRCGVGVVYDSVNSSKTKHRKIIRELAKKNKAETIVIWFQIDPDTAYYRTQHRDRRKAEDKFAKKYTEASFRDALGSQQNPVTGEDYAVISGKHTYRSQRNAIMKKLYDLYLLEATQMNHKVVKPGLVNLIPNRGDIGRRNISIR
jgi:predicted kinase